MNKPEDLRKDQNVENDSINKNDTKRTSITFRLDEKILNKLRYEASYNEIALNAYVNQVLKRIVEWDLFEKKMGMVPIAKPIVIHLFECLTEDKIIKLAKSIGKNAVKESVIFMKQDMDFISFVEWLKSRMSIFEIEVLNYNNRDRYDLVIKHDLGRNWSLFHKIMFDEIYFDLVGKHIDNIFLSDSMLSFTIAKMAI